MRRTPRDQAHRALKPLAVAVLLVGVLWLSYGVAEGLGWVGNVDRTQHLAGNDALLRQVPVYPGASYVGTAISDSKEGNGSWPEGFGPITSYTTAHDYKLDDPPKRPVVIDWYRSRLAGRCEFRTGSGYGGGRYFDATFRCGNGSVVITPYNDWLLIKADYDAYSD